VTDDYPPLEEVISCNGRCEGRKSEEGDSLFLLDQRNFILMQHTILATSLKMATALVLVLMACIFLEGCKKGKEEPEESCTVPCEGTACIAEMKDWFYFQPGTYWIYEEQSSGALDTVTVLDATDSPSSFFMETESSVLEEWVPNYWVKYKYRYQYFGDNHCITRPACTCHRVNRIKGRTGDYVGAANILTYPPIEGDYIYPTGGGGYN
jgi:hypothetical protein